MTTNKEFKHTEKLLYDYFERPSQIEILTHRVEVLKKQIEDIEHDIETTNVHLDTCLNMGIDYSQTKVQTSFTGSYVENEVCRQIDNLKKEKADAMSEINILNRKIRRTIKINMIIYDNLMLLSDENKDFIKCKYKDKVPFPEIFDKTHMSRSAWFEKRKKLIENIAQWFRFVKI